MLSSVNIFAILLMQNLRPLQYQNHAFFHCNCLFLIKPKYNCTENYPYFMTAIAYSNPLLSCVFLLTPIAVSANKQFKFPVHYNLPMLHKNSRTILQWITSIVIA